jgi:hypothetical protein
MKYDKNRRTIEHALLGIDDNLVFVEENGYAKVKLKFDENGNQTYYAYYDAQGNLCKPKDFPGILKNIYI